MDECIAGSDGAWERLYEQHHSALLVSIRLALGRQWANDDLADEIASQTWCRLVDGQSNLLQRYDPARSCLLTYLTGIARHTILHHRRAEERRHNRELASRHTESRPPHPANPESLIKEFLQSLTPREQVFYNSYLIARGSADERPWFSAANVRILRHRILRKLRSFLYSE